MNSVRQKINAFMAGPQYVALFALVTALTFVLGIELIYYGLVVAVLFYVCIWGDDLLPLVPMFAFVYVAPSIHNNPGKSANSVFSKSSKMRSKPNRMISWLPRFLAFMASFSSSMAAPISSAS